MSSADRVGAADRAVAAGGAVAAEGASAADGAGAGGASAADIAQLAGTCIAAAEAGAAVLRDLFDKPRAIEHKSRIDLVTDADRASEGRILEVLRERAPGVRVLAEESGAHAGSGEVRFIVDPLDGTTNYAHGIPLYACTVAAEIGGRAVAGCTIDPSRGEIFHAARGAGAFVRSASGERRLSVAAAATFDDAVVCTGFPYDKREQLAQLLRWFAAFTERAQGTRRLGSAAIDLAWVAAGRLDGFWEQGLKPWDVAAGQVLVEEARGVVTRFDGAALLLAGGEIVAANPVLHRGMLALLTSVR